MRTRACTIAVVVIVLLTSTSFAQHRRLAATGGAIPPGTQLSVRMIDHISSASAKSGSTFRAALDAPVIVNGRTLYPKGADVTGTVVRAHPSGRLSDPGELELVVTRIAGYPVNVEPLRFQGDSHAKSNVTKIGGGAAAGAIIGGIAGGGKGAAIGAGVGAATGTGVAAATGKKEAVVESEAVLHWIVTAPAVAQSAPAYRRPSTNGAYRERDRHDRDYDDDDDAYASERSRGRSTPDFGDNERRIIRRCMVDNRSSLPPGLAKRDRLPPGLERQLRVNGTLPPGLQKRVQPLPGGCSAGLPRLPSGWVRVVLGSRVLMLDAAFRIADMFSLDDNE